MSGATDRTTEDDDPRREGWPPAREGRPTPEAETAGPEAAAAEPARFILPQPLRELTGGERILPLRHRAGTVREALAGLREEHPAVHARLVTERGELRPHVNLFVEREEVRRTGGLDTPLGDGAEILVLPSVSGG